MKIKRGDLQQLIRKNMYHENIEQINEVFVKASSLGAGFKFEFCDFGEIEGTKGYNMIMEYIEKGQSTDRAQELFDVEEELKELDPTAPDYGRKKSDLLNRKEKLEIEKTEAGASLLDNYPILKGITLPGFIDNMKFLLNVGAYTAMGPAATLYCKTLKNVVDVVNKTIGVAVDEPTPGDKTTKERLTDFMFFYNELSASIGLKIPSKAMTVLNSYLDEQGINTTPEKVMFKVIYLNEILAIETGRNSLQLEFMGAPSPTGRSRVDTRDPDQITSAVSNFKALIDAASGTGRKDKFIRGSGGSKSLSDIDEDGENRKNLLRVFRRMLQKGVRTDKSDKEKYVKDIDFRIENTDLADRLVDELSEKSRRKKSTGDDAAVDKAANDYEALVIDIKKALSRIP